MRRQSVDAFGRYGVSRICWTALSFKSNCRVITTVSPDGPGRARRSRHPSPPGSSFVAHITPPRAGTFIYHTHWHDETQIRNGLYGPLIVLEPGQKLDPDQDRTFVFSVGIYPPLGFAMLINGSPGSGADSHRNALPVSVDQHHRRWIGSPCAFAVQRRTRFMESGCERRRRFTRRTNPNLSGRHVPSGWIDLRRRVDARKARPNRPTDFVRNSCRCCYVPLLRLSEVTCGVLVRAEVPTNFSWRYCPLTCVCRRPLDEVTWPRCLAMHLGISPG